MTSFGSKDGRSRAAFKKWIRAKILQKYLVARAQVRRTLTRILISAIAGKGSMCSRKSTIGERKLCWRTRRNYSDFFIIFIYLTIFKLLGIL